MKTRLFAVTLLWALAAQAREPRFYEKGTVAEMNGVECGTEEKGAKGIGGVLLGTDSHHQRTRELLCQEYVLRSDRLVYRIRPKEEKHPALLPVGEQAEFRIHKDMMFLRVPEGDGKERQYFVVSMTPRTDVDSTHPVASIKDQSK